MLLAALHLPPGARFETLPAGFAFVFDDPSTRVEVRERVTPLRRAREIFDAALGVATTAPIREYLTSEGEHAAMLGVRTDTRFALLGVAYGDDAYRLVVGHTADPARADEIAACVRGVTLDLSLGLAEDRRRRYRYTPPAGFVARSRHGLITEWLAPGFPAVSTMITVYPSSPAREVLFCAFDRSLHEMQWGGFTVAATSGPHPLALSRLAAHELHLTGAWRDGGRREVTIIALHDHARTYIARLDHDGTDTDRARAALHALAASVQPLGRRVAGAASSARSLFAHMVD